MSLYPIDRRLLSVASFVRAGAVLADIGTDHGYLPVFLLSEGRIERAVLTDINEMPLASARSNVAAAGLSDRVELVLTDGADALSDRGITDFCVCGMGGELIADIVLRADAMRHADVRVILQPMSRQSHLRRELYRGGFVILDERYSHADGKYYVCMLAEFCGTPCEISPLDAELGFAPWRDEDREARLGYLGQKLRGHRRALEGRLKGGEKDSELALLCEGIEREIKLHEERSSI